MVVQALQARQKRAIQTMSLQATKQDNNANQQRCKPTTTQKPPSISLGIAQTTKQWQQRQTAIL